MTFTIPVQLDYVVANWDSLFWVYVDCRTQNNTQEVLAFNITSYSGGNTINFTVTFQDPYLYGLLNKKNDNLVIALQP
jgi:hypothetical protein